MHPPTEALSNRSNDASHNSHPPRTPEAIRALRARKHKERIRLANAYADEFEKRQLDDVAFKLRSCHQKEVLACCKACNANWYVLDKCKLRVCPICSKRVFIERARYIKACCHKAKYPKLITLTQPTITEDPREGIRNLQRWFAELRKDDTWKSVKGGAYTIEVLPKDSHWHIHMHVLVDADFIPYQKLWSAWRRISGNEVPQTDIRAADSAKAVEYISKYTAKSVNAYLGELSIVDWYLAVKGFRLFVTFGSFYNAKIEDLDPAYQPFIPEHVCPCCKAKSTTFLARDGPVIFGYEYWDAARTLYTQGLPTSRDYTPPEEPTENI